jgi:type IX secretion system PorP/SprF family membrane protein
LATNRFWQGFGSQIENNPARRSKTIYKMRKLHYPALLAFSLWAHAAFGQQDPMFTNYQFNSLIFNPAYAGSNEHLTLNVIHRQQWVGFEGAPSTQSLLAHTPLKNERVGLGASIVKDKIGPSGSFDFATAYAYRFPVGSRKRLKLSLGLQGSVANWYGDWFDVTVEQGSDPSFQRRLSRWLPNFGAGAYLYGKRFYAGLGCPRLIEHDLRKAEAEGDDFFGKTYRHYYATLGAAFPLDGDNLVFRPSLLVKRAGLFSALRRDDAFQNIGAPTALNLDASFFLRQMLWLGASYRTAVEAGDSSHDSMDFWAAWSLRNGLRFGASYDVNLSKIRQASSGSFEVMLGYEFDIKVKKVASPRYF